MWYKEHSEREVDLSRPIIAEDGKNVELLLPQIEKGSYKIVGYNWFNLTVGQYNSCATFKTVEAAIRARSNCRMYNAGLEVLNKRSIK